MTGHEQHTVTVHVNEFRAYAVCTCIDPATDEPWRSPDTVSEPVARRYGEAHAGREVWS